MTQDIAYVVNQYPAPSHTFIRREILALENIGWNVHRFTHRESLAKLVDESDINELEKTSVLVSGGVIGILGSIIRSMARRPIKTGRALVMSIRMAWTGERRLLAHLGYFGLACVLSERLRELCISRLHAHFSTNPSDVAYLCNAICGVTYSLTFHATYEYDDPSRRLNLREKISNAHFVVVVSDHGYRTLTNKFSEFRDKFKLIRCGLENEWFEREPTPVPDSCQLLSIARLADQKNPELLIQVAALLKKQGIQFRLVMAGDGPLRSKIERLIEKDNLSSHVFLAGWCTQEQIKCYLEESLAVVLASKSEGIPIAILEAFAFGRIAIATDVGGVGELVETRKTGWLTPPNDMCALYAAISACLAAKHGEVQLLADAARGRVLDYDVRKSASALDKVFLENSI